MPSWDPSNGWMIVVSEARLTTAHGNPLITFRRRLPGPAAAPAREVCFPGLRAATVADMLRSVADAAGKLTGQLSPRPHGKTRRPDRLLRPSVGSRLAQLHWVHQKALSRPQTPIGQTLVATPPRAPIGSSAGLQQEATLSALPACGCGASARLRPDF